MPRKNRIPASAIENRDSQRRSRARRREFVEQLQQQIQDYEHRGVQATIEMQRVARAVVWENKQLRRQLHLRGVSQYEIDHQLLLAGSVGNEPDLDFQKPLQRNPDSLTPRGQRYSAIRQPSFNTLHLMAAYPQNINSSSTPPRTSISNPILPVSTRGLAISTPGGSTPPRSTASGDVADADGGVANNRDYEKLDSYDSHTPQYQNRASISFVCNDSGLDTGSNTDILPPITDCFCPPDSPISVSGHWDRGISCNKAINIITGLHTDADSDRVRDLLQCKESDDCLVQNSSVFQILDTIA